MIKQKFLQRAAIGLATTNPSKTSAEVIKAAMDLTNMAEDMGMFDPDFPDRTVSPAMKLLHNIDWDLLREQKDFLLGQKDFLRELRSRHDNPSTGYRVVSGLIQLLYSIQNAASDEGMDENIIFGGQDEE